MSYELLAYQGPAPCALITPIIIRDVENALFLCPPERLLAYQKSNGDLIFTNTYLLSYGRPALPVR